MTKRAFIYFIFLFQLLGFYSFAKEHKAEKCAKARTWGAVPHFANHIKRKIDFWIVKKHKKSVKTIIRVDKAK